jgi:hypothetical protein
MFKANSQGPNPDILKQDLGKLYGEVYTSIRETDQVSFRLLGYIPLVSGSGAGLLTTLINNNLLKPLPLILLSALGAVVTFGFYRWERRNIQTCERLYSRAKYLEQLIGFEELAGREAAPRLLGKPIGKTQAEKIIYTASVIAWLVPILVALT